VPAEPSYKSGSELWFNDGNNGAKGADMTLPKYLRPIYDVDAHGLTKTEKVVRMVIFTPLLIVFSVPTVLAVVFVCLAGYWAFILLTSGVGNIFANPAQYSFEISIFAALAALLIFSNVIARKIRRHFLPFG